MNSTKAPNRWHNADLLRAAILFFSTWVLLRFLWVTRSVVLITILAVLLGVALSRGVDKLEKLHIKRAIGTVLILLVLFGTIVAAGFAIAPTLAAQMQQLTQTLPSALESIERRIRREPLANAALTAAASEASPQQGSQGAQQQPQQSGRQQPQQSAGQGERPAAAGAQTERQGGAQQQSQGGSAPASGEGEKKPGEGLIRLISGHAGSFAQMIFPFLANSVSAIAGFIVVIFLAAYFAVDPKSYRRAIIRIVPPARRPQADALLTELADLLTQWLVARVAAMVIIGLLTGGALAVLDVPAAAALGVIAGMLEFIPFLGPIVSAIPAIAMAAVVSPTTMLYVVILFVVLQQIEGNLVTPLLMKNRLEVPPAVTIIAVAALGIVFGILGMLIAEPLAATVILAVKRLYVRKIEDDPAPGLVEV